MFPVVPGVEIVMASSDHFVLDLAEAQLLRLGERMSVLLEYPSLVQAIM